MSTVEESTARDLSDDDGMRGWRGWTGRLWAVVLVFALVTAARSWQVGIPVRDPHGNILRGRIVTSLVLLVVLVLADGVRRSWRAERSWRGTGRALAERWTPARIGLVLLALAAYHAVYFCYHNLKSWDVFLAPRDADVEALDRWLLLGHSPAVLLHDLFGTHVMASVLVDWYETFPAIMSAGFVAALALHPRLREGFVFVASMAWIWILGVTTYYLVPTLGPFHQRPQDFASLPHTVVTATQARYVAERAQLLAHPHWHGSFAQISAFASLHVGVTTVVWLMCRYYRLRVLSAAMGVFLVGTCVATVYLGWHFAVDDVAGFAIGWLAVWLGRRTVTPRSPERSGSPRREPDAVPTPS